MRGVPAFGLPNKSNCSGRIVSPARAASPLKSMRANINIPRSRNEASRRSMVAATDRLAGITMKPRLEPSSDMKASPMIVMTHVYHTGGLLSRGTMAG